MRSFCEGRIWWGRTTIIALAGSFVLLAAGCAKETVQREPPAQARTPMPLRTQAAMPIPRLPPAFFYDARTFGKCAPCHALDRKTNGIGPHLVGIYGRPIGSVENYRYSEALKSVGGTWDAATLDRFLADPEGFAPGTRMTFRGIESAEMRAAIIAYLQREAQASDPE